MIFDCLDEINTEAVVEYVAGLQQEDGSFVGDAWGEVDNRFTFCAVACLALLGGSRWFLEVFTYILEEKLRIFI